MALTLIVAMLVGLAAPFIRGWFWGVPFGLLSIATVLRSFIGAALTAIFIGVVALFALRATPMDQADINRIAGPLGGAVSCPPSCGSKAAACSPEGPPPNPATATKTRNLAKRLMVMMSRPEAEKALFPV